MDGVIPAERQCFTDVHQFVDPVDQTLALVWRPQREARQFFGQIQNSLFQGFQRDHLIDQALSLIHI